MELVETLVVVIHVVVAVALVGLILLQHGKGADMGAAFGAGASQTLFGSQGSASFLSKFTSTLAVVFFASSFSLAYFAKEKSDVLSQQDFLPRVVEDSGLTTDAELEEIPALDASDEGSGADEGMPELE